MRPSSGVVLRAGVGGGFAALLHDVLRVVLVGAGDVQVELPAARALLDGLVDVLDLLERVGRDLVGLQRAHRRHLAAHDGLGDDRQRVGQLEARGRRELAPPRVAAVGARQQLGLPQQPVVLDQGHEGGLMALAVVAVDDVVVGARAAAQAHDLVHRRHALGAGLDALEAVRAVVDAGRVLGEVLQALLLLGVAGIAHEAVGLGQRGRADEQRVDLHGQAVRDAGAALDARHRLRDVDHRLAVDEVLALGDRLLVDEPRSDALDLLPVDGVHVHDEVLDDGHVAHRLDLDDAVARGLPRAVQVGVAGQAGLAVDAHAARAADRGLARTADADRAVEAALGLQDALQHRAVRLELDRVLDPVGRLAGLGVEAADAQGEALGRVGVHGLARAAGLGGKGLGGHLVLPLFRLPLRDGHGRVVDLGAVAAVARQGDVLHPLVVVAVGEVGAELRPARLLALDRGDDRALGAVEHVPQLDRAQDVLVEDRALVVDVGRLGLLLEAADDLERVLEPGLLAEDRDVAVHLGAELVLDLGDAPAGLGTLDDRVDPRRLVVEPGPGLRLGHRHARRALRGVLAGAAAEDQRVQQRVGPEAVAAVDRDAGDVARGVEALDGRRAVDVGLDAAHDVVLARADEDRLARDVDAGEVLADVDDLAQRLERALLGDDGDVEVDADAAGADAAALVDLGLLGARDHVARGQLHLVGRVLLHEALAVAVEQMGALAAGALGDEEPVLDQRGRVVLDHLHVHQRRADPVGLRDAVAGADQAVGRRLEALAGAAGGLDHRLGGEQLHRAVADVPRDRSAAVAVVVLHERGDEPLLVAVDPLVVLHELLVEHVQERLTRDVGDVVGAGRGGPAERAGAEPALRVAVERHTAMLEPEHLAGGLAAHDLDRVLIAQVVRSLHGVERVRLPRVVRVQRGVDAARGRVGVRPDGVDLGHDGHGRAALGGRQSRPLPGEAGADDEDVMCGHG